jgi:hypothetical protein
MFCSILKPKKSQSASTAVIMPNMLRWRAKAAAKAHTLAGGFFR